LILIIFSPIICSQWTSPPMKFIPSFFFFFFFVKQIEDAASWTYPPNATSFHSLSFIFSYDESRASFSKGSPIRSSLQIYYLGKRASNSGVSNGCKIITMISLMMLWWTAPRSTKREGERAVGGGQGKRNGLVELREKGRRTLEKRIC
jgi:hypothetical protein